MSEYSEGSSILMTDSPTTLGRNDRCHCGSGRKYKQCCLEKDEQALRAQRAEAAAAAGPSAADTSADPREGAPVEAHVKQTQPHQKLQQPWNRSARGMQSFSRVSAPRKTGGGG